MSELQILIFNAAVFSILAVYHYWKNRKLNIAFYILAYYSICAWGALLYHEHELFHYMRGRETYSIIPFLYLIPVILLFAYPRKSMGNDKASAPFHKLRHGALD